MEVEENFQRTEKKLREANRKIERVNFELVKEIAERQRAETELKEANKTLQRLATLDGLTQIANRRQLDERLHQEWERMKREQKPLSLILCDIDFFKLYNDAYGHQSGDNCLCAITQAIHVNVKRAGDLVARYGGEEFAVILPNTNGPQAIHVAELIRKEMLQLAIDHKKSPISPYVTLSLGVACIIPRRELLAGQLVKEADEALYEAKRRGRNRVVLKRFNVPLSS
jgi:diguanylate cyclase (GGDEF)-like protein